MLLLGDNMKRNEFLSRKHIDAASATAEIGFSPQRHPLLWPHTRAGVAPKSHYLSTCSSVLLTHFGMKCYKWSLLYFLIKSNPNLQSYFVMRYIKAVLAENCTPFPGKKHLPVKGGERGWSGGNIFVQPRSAHPFIYLSFREKSSLSDLKSHNRRKNLRGETKYLGNSFCWPPGWLRELRSVWERCQRKD